MSPLSRFCTPVPRAVTSCRHTPHTRTLVPAALLTALLFALGVGNGRAAAQATFSASASSEFVVIGTDTMAIAIAFGPIVGTVDKAGVADAITGGSQTLGPGGSPLSLVSGVAGFADPPPVSFARATHTNGATVTLVNAAAVPHVATFGFDYAFDIEALATAGFSSASAFFHISGIDDEILTVDGLPAPEYLRFFSANSRDLPGPLMGGGGVTLGVVVAPFSTSIFSVITDAGGFAVVGPEPGAFLLCIVPLLVGTVAHARRWHGTGPNISKRRRTGASVG